MAADPLRVVHYSDLETAFDQPERIGRVAATLRRLSDGRSLLVDGGDTLGPGLLAMETAGRHAVPFLESVAPDVATFGNHDLDHGLGPLRRVVGASPQTWVTTNLEAPDGSPLLSEVGVRRTATLSVGSDRIGVVGLTDPRSVEGHHVDGIGVRDPVEAARDGVAGLRDRGVDVVVAVAHLGGTDDLARTVDVDAVLGGHTHETRAETVAGTPVLHPGARAEVVGTVRFDGGSRDADLVPATEGPVANDVADEYRSLRADLGLSAVVTTLDEPIHRDASACYPESVVGNAVADAYRWATGAEVAIYNAKMLRAGPPLAGRVTVGDLRSLTPFDNRLHTATLSGGELLVLLENLGAPDAVDVGPEVFGHVGGARLAWRRTGADLALVEASVGDAPVDRSASYEVTAPSFAFHGDLFAPLTPERIEATPTDQHEALLGYVRSEGIPTATDGRMRATVDDGPAALHSLR